MAITNTPVNDKYGVYDLEIPADEIKRTLKQSASHADVNALFNQVKDKIEAETKLREDANVVFEQHISEINHSIYEATAIAKGKATGYSFDTLEDLDFWLANEDNVSKLVIGDNLYIRATDTSDYWWDGTQKQQLETQKVNLDEYYTKTEINAKVDEISEKTNGAETTSNDAKQIAQSVRDDADSGLFNGKDGADYILTEVDKEEIKTNIVEELTRSSDYLPDVLAVNTTYDLGEQDTLILNLPTGKLGDFIEVDFLSTTTPTTLTITANSGISDYDLIPDENTIYSLYFNWIRLDAVNYGWGFGFSEYTRTVVE